MAAVEDTELAVSGTRELDLRAAARKVDVVVVECQRQLLRQRHILATARLMAQLQQPRGLLGRLVAQRLDSSGGALRAHPLAHELCAKIISRGGAAPVRNHGVAILCSGGFGALRLLPLGLPTPALKG